MTAPRMRDGVIQRGKTWSYVVRERDPLTGKTKSRMVGGFPTRVSAKAARDRARSAVHRGTHVLSRSVTVGEWLDLWITAHEVQLKPSTAKSYRDNISRYLKPILGREQLQSLSPAKLSAVFKRLYESGGQNGKALSPRTVEFARAVLRRSLQDAVAERLLEVNPVVGTKRPRVVKPHHTTWTASQLQGFLDGLSPDDRWAPLWQLAAATGMRRGELLALRWTDVDLDRAVIAVERSVTQVRQQRIYVTPKNHERRDITIDPRTAETLTSWRTVQLEERLTWEAAYQDSEDLVFTWQDGRPVLPDYITKIFGALTSKMPDLPRLVLHELRHTHATILLRDGVPVHIVAKRLGHRDPSVTLNVYADSIPDDDGRAMTAFASAVWGA